MSDSSDCVFCRIVSGEIPCIKVLEDDASLAFVDIGPLAEGHTLLIPKRHFQTLDDVPGELIGTVTAHLPRLVRAVMQVTGAEGCNVLQNNGPVAGQVVGHVHFHVIPRVSGDALGYRWPAGVYAEGRGAEVGRLLAGALCSSK